MGETQYSLIFANNAGTCIVRIKDDLFYYGNGDDLNMLGKSPMKFLRFNPYMEYVEGKGYEVPPPIIDWIEENT